MAAEVIDGKTIAQAVRAEVRADVAAWVGQGGAKPGLATVLVGDDPASAVYVGGKQKASAEVGIEGFDHRLPQDAAHDDVERLLQRLNDDPAVSGILLQLPTPPQVDGSGLTELIDPAKDVDGLTPVSTGLLAKGRPGLRPCTPAGVMELLRRHEVALEGAEAVVVGRSDLVLARVCREPVVEALDADLGARLLLAAHVDRGGSVVADQDRRQAGDVVPRRDPFRDFRADLVAHFLGDGLAVDERHSGGQASV